MVISLTWHSYLLLHWHVSGCGRCKICSADYQRKENREKGQGEEEEEEENGGGVAW